MMMEEHKELIAKYNENNISDNELALLEQFIEKGEILLSQLEDVDKLQQLLPSIEDAEVSKTSDDNFYSMLAKESSKLKQGNEMIPGFITWWNSIRQSNYQWAYSVALVVFGIIGGYFWSLKSSATSEVQQLTAEVQQMKELMMLTMIEKESTTDRLKAVSLTSDMDTVSKGVSRALLTVLVNDENTNVRLAAIEALAPFSNDPEVRRELILAIKYQESPLVQLALAELMVSMKEKKSVKEFETIIKNENTPNEVKKELQSAMQALI